MLKRAAPKPPRVFILRPSFRALAAGAPAPVSIWVEDRPRRRPVEVESARAEVVHARVKRVRIHVKETGDPQRGPDAANAAK